MLVWDETEILACLEAEPQVEPDGVSYQYTVRKDGMRMELLVYPFDGDVYLDLYRDGVEQPVFAMNILECPGIRAVRDASGEHLEIADAGTIEGRYDGESAIPNGVRIWANPTLRIELY